MRTMKMATFALMAAAGVGGCGGGGGSGGATANPGVVAGPLVTIERVNVTPTGEDSADEAGGSALSGDGRYVVFASAANDLVAGHPSGLTQVFRRDRTTGTTTIVSTNAAGEAANALCDGTLAVSDDGEWVAFWTMATNLVSDDPATQDVFLKHMTSGSVTRVCMADPATPADGWSYLADMTPDARFVLFWSNATNLVPGDTNASPDLFRWSRDTGAIVRVSVSDSEQQAPSGSLGGAAISDDGDRVVFSTGASNLVADDDNGRDDVFLRVISAGTTELVSLTDGDARISTAASTDPDISGNGQRVLFHTDATEVAPGDAPGPSVFVRDLQAGTTTCVSGDGTRTGASGSAFAGRISGDGTTVVFVWQTPADFGATVDVYVRSANGVIRRASVSGSNGLADGLSSAPVISRDGAEVAFMSSATNLVPGDHNALMDVFVAVIPPSGSG